MCILNILFNNYYNICEYLALVKNNISFLKKITENDFGTNIKYNIY